MPRIFDNIDPTVLRALRNKLEVAERSRLCVGYFNLCGWRAVDCCIKRWAGGDVHCCRLLVGMRRLPEAELRLAVAGAQVDMDTQTALRRKKSLATQLRNQLTVGFPTNGDEAVLWRLPACHAG